MSDKKDKDSPDADDIQKMMQDMFGKLGINPDTTFPGFDTSSAFSDEEEIDDEPVEIDEADA
ncbi:MAG: hypothetical protein ACPG6P_08540, partial [Akkermansiaceae bacterium]